MDCRVWYINMNCLKNMIFFEAIRKVSINRCTIRRLMFYKECCVGSGTLKIHKNARQLLQIDWNGKY